MNIDKPLHLRWILKLLPPSALLLWLTQLLLQQALSLTALTGSVNTVVSGIVALTTFAPDIPTVMADNFPKLPNSTHLHGIIAYRIEQLEGLERLLEVKRECNGIFLSNQAPHLT